MTAYLGDVAALARKDLRLELRARDTLPAMALFVVATLVVFHFALPGGASDDAAYGLLWVALVFTALLGLGAGLVAGERGRRARRARPRDRRIAARSGSGRRSPRSRSSLRGRGRRTTRVRALLRAARRAVASPASSSPRSGSAPSARSSRRWQRPPGAARSCCRCSSSRSRSRSSSAASGRASPRSPGRTSRSSGSTTPSSRYFRGRRSSTSSPSERHR